MWYGSGLPLAATCTHRSSAATHVPRSVSYTHLKEASAFEGIQFLCFLYFCDSQFPGVRIMMDDLKGLPGKGAIREGDGHPGKVRADIKANGEIRAAVKHLK